MNQPRRIESEWRELWQWVTFVCILGAVVVLAGCASLNDSEMGITRAEVPMANGQVAKFTSGKEYGTVAVRMNPKTGEVSFRATAVEAFPGQAIAAQAAVQMQALVNALVLEFLSRGMGVAVPGSTLPAGPVPLPSPILEEEP